MNQCAISSIFHSRPRPNFSPQMPGKKVPCPRPFHPFYNLNLGFPEVALVSMITADEVLSLRFDTKLEHSEWVEELAKLWQIKYSPEELKAKNKLRQVPIDLSPFA